MNNNARSHRSARVGARAGARAGVQVSRRAGVGISAGVGAAVAASTLLAGLLLPTTVQAADLTAPTLDDYKSGPTIAQVDFNNLQNGATGTVQAGDTAVHIHGTAATTQGQDGSTAANISSKFWMDLTRADNSALLQGKHAITISYDANPAASGNTGWTMYAAPNANAQSYGNEHYIGFLDKTTSVIFERYNNSGTRIDMGANTKNVQAGWRHIDVVVTDESTSLYVNGKLENTRTPINSTHTLDKVLGSTGGIVQLGRANWGGGEYFTGAIDNFSIVDSTAAAVRAALVNVQVPASATESFAVPVSSNGTAITWKSDNAAIAVQSDGIATVTRPATGQPDATVTLTAQAGDLSKIYTVVVPHIPSDAEGANNDLASLSVYAPEDVRSNLVLPTAAPYGSTVTWKVQQAGAVAQARITDGFDAQSKTLEVQRPAAGAKADTVVLTVTVTKGDAVVTKDYTLTVSPLPAQQEENEAYVWAFFTGEGVGGEKISLAASKGNNALDWNTLNNGTPVFTSTLGEQGLRDPFIMKSHDGDKFYMLATDLKISGRTGSFNGAQRNGSLYIEIWESNDLVNWSNERHVKVSSDYAGNTWAPEAYWDDELGEYVVYWASNLYDTTDNSLSMRTKPTYNRMMIATTKDFITFGEPKEWINVDRRGGDGSGSIDATVQKVGDTYYRVYKDEKVMKLRQEKSKTLASSIGGDGVKDYATALEGSDWSEVAVNLGDGQPNGYGGTFSAGEGPSLFQANAGDVNGYQYYLFVDQPNYHGGPNHYVPMATSDIASGSWTVIGDKMPEANFPVNSDQGKPRHGTVIPVTRAQYQKMLTAMAPQVAVKSVAAFDHITVTEGEQVTLPATAHIQHVDGSEEDVAVAWDAAPTAVGDYTVKGIAQDNSRMPVEVQVTIKAKALEPEPGSEPVTTPEVATSAASVAQGAKVTLTAKGFVTGHSVRFELHSTPVVLGFADANGDGVATLEATIPADAAVGDHEVVAIDTTDESITATAPIAVTAHEVSTEDPDTGNNSGADADSDTDNESSNSNTDSNTDTGADSNTTGGTTVDNTNNTADTNSDNSANGTNSTKAGNAAANTAANTEGSTQLASTGVTIVTLLCATAAIAAAGIVLQIMRKKSSVR